MNNEIVNRVASSNLITMDLDDFYPLHKRMEFDVAQTLFQGMILREKEFRLFVKEHDWHIYQDAAVAVFCSDDVIIPAWVYMIIGTKLSGIASFVFHGKPEQRDEELFLKEVNKINPLEYKNRKVVIKGCSDYEVPMSVYLTLSHRLAPYVSSLMYGEPCSTVPVYKSTK